MWSRILRVPLFILLCAPLAFSAPPASPAAELHTLIQNVRTEMLPEQAMEYMRSIYSTDRWFNFAKFQETADYLKLQMQDIGLQQVEIGTPPADGETQFGFWTMPMAWDVKQATLEIVEPKVSADLRVLADYRKVPTSLGEWSGPTPPGGITAEVVEVKDWPAQKIAQMDLRGKLALTDENPDGIKWALAKAHAFGAINTGTENPSLRDGRQWVNAWGDNGWAFIKGSTPLICFSITPREGDLLRRLLARNGKVRVRAVVDTRYYKGVYPYTTGVIPGAGPEEVLALGHTAEQGAEDNATGVAALMEAMATLNRLIASGKLPRPRRTIRILAMPELYGSMPYIANHRDRIKQTIAALCLDTPAGQYDMQGTEYTFYMNPEVASSYTDAFILKVADEYFSSIHRLWHEHPYLTGTDSYLGDPTIGVPTVWAYSGSGVETHHNSEDTPDRVDSRSLRDISTVSAAYLYYLANAGTPQAVWLAGLSQTRGYRQVLDAVSPFLDEIADAGSQEELGRLLQQALEEIDYTVGRETQSIDSVLRLAPPAEQQALQASLAPLSKELVEFGNRQAERVRAAAAERARLLGIRNSIQPIAAPDPEAAAASLIVVKRKSFGTIPLDQIPPDQREGYPSGAWALVPISALYWCDGQRNLEQVIHLTKMEMGPTRFDFVGYFRFLRDHGFVEFVKGK
jgi:Peptidase family M28